MTAAATAATDVIRRPCENARALPKSIDVETMVSIQDPRAGGERARSIDTFIATLSRFNAQCCTQVFIAITTQLCTRLDTENIRAVFDAMALKCAGSKAMRQTARKYNMLIARDSIAKYDA